MSLQISKALPNAIYDSSGSLLSADYWRVSSISLDNVHQTFSIEYSGYASASAYAANPFQIPLMNYQVGFPDLVNAPSATWPFNPSEIATNYPGQPMAFLLAAEAYALSMPFFSGATQVP